MPESLTACNVTDLSFDMMGTTLFANRESLVAIRRPGMALWRDQMFAFMARNAALQRIFSASRGTG